MVGLGGEVGGGWLRVVGWLVVSVAGGGSLNSVLTMHVVLSLEKALGREVLEALQSNLSRLHQR